MRQDHKEELIEYALDHYAYFEAWPVEFEASDGTVYEQADYWHIIEDLPE